MAPPGGPPHGESRSAGAPAAGTPAAGTPAESSSGTDSETTPVATAAGFFQGWLAGPDRSLRRPGPDDARQRARGRGLAAARPTNGFLTTPPSSKGVLWLAAKAPRSASESQLQAMSRLLGEANNRPLKSMNARRVLEQTPRVSVYAYKQM
ncbi:hypothetical protein EKG36_10295 [Halomonas nitroreducens]|uniref:Uncharacterized protein n=1 Tax=Halomonas nitroreducens TaxID=447425 RepID=A0A3S0I7K4_9GAMM|nr:carbonic anhydrase family protein [Halomonas nitroreducens]RTR03312.1 hypothetical protein EKG36_10295 [Halomonas nitroreducens]